MQQQTTNNFTPLDDTTLKALCKDVPETNITGNDWKKFSVVDLWHIQKHMKLSGKRRATIS